MTATLDRPTTHDRYASSARPIHLWPSDRRGAPGAVAACGATEMDHSCPPTSLAMMPNDMRCPLCQRPVCPECLAVIEDLLGLLK